MKKLFIILSLFFLICSTTSHAQETYYTASGISLDVLDNELIAVSFRAGKPLARSWFLEINHGQACIDRLNFQPRMEYLRTCSGLLDARRNPVEVNNYIQGLNLMEKLGWKLETISVDTDSDGGSGPESHKYIFRRKGNLN